MSEQKVEVGQAIRWRWNGKWGRGVVKQIRPALRGKEVVYLTEDISGQWYIVQEEDIVPEVKVEWPDDTNQVSQV